MKKRQSPSTLNCHPLTSMIRKILIFNCFFFNKSDNSIGFCRYYNLTIRQIDCDEENQLISRITEDTDVASKGSEYDYEEEEDSESLKCDKTIKASEFVLQSPKYPSEYPNGVSKYHFLLGI